MLWDAEVEIDEALVRALLVEQFPELDASSARFLGEGWDNSVWVVEERLAFRFPRRRVAVPLTERELVILPALVPLLPLPVPEPSFLGRPSERFPWPFLGCALLPGSEPADAELGDAERVGLGAQLGRFLRSLHDPATRASVDPDRELPADPNSRADMALRVSRAREQLAELEEAGAWRATESVTALLEEAARLPPPMAEPVLAHGDLHHRHVLVHDGTLSGVIDWGDVCVADPSIDLVLVWSLLDPAGRACFEVGYGSVSDERRLRSRVLALQLCSMLALYARAVGNASLERESLAGLGRTLVDWG